MDYQLMSAIIASEVSSTRYVESKIFFVLSFEELDSQATH
jgi:hypothetical protein